MKTYEINLKITLPIDASVQTRDGGLQVGEARVAEIADAIRKASSDAILSWGCPVLAGDLTPCEPAEYVITAEAHSDDHSVEIDFDAAPFFEQASDEEIIALRGISWGSNYEADRVLDFCNAQDGPSLLFAYLNTKPRSFGESVGFECNVDEDDAEAWVMTHRRHLAVGVIG